MYRYADDLKRLAADVQRLFDAGGRRSLQVVALGDFSRRGREQARHVALCQDHISVRALEAGDRDEWALVERNRDFLGACEREDSLRKGVARRL